MARAPFKTGYVVPFLAGLVVAPFVKPLLRVAVKTSVGMALQAKTLAAGAAEEFQDIVAEASANVSGADGIKPSGVSVVPPAK